MKKSTAGPALRRSATPTCSYPGCLAGCKPFRPPYDGGVTHLT